MTKSNLLMTVCATLVFLTSIPARAAPILIGNGTLNTANDLTVVQDGTIVYEFLDLTPTYNMTVLNAVAQYSGQGFHWANGAEVGTLFGAFHIDYGHWPGHQVLPGATVPGLNDPIGLRDHLGLAPGTFAALGWIDEFNPPPYEAFHTYACLGQCGVTPVFIVSQPNFWPSISVIGTFLVHSYDTAPSGNPVPVPGVLPLLALGLIGFGAARRFRRSP